MMTRIQLWMIAAVLMGWAANLPALEPRTAPAPAPAPAPISAPVVPPPPTREFRAAWIATVANIDWPSKPGLPVAQQQAELVSLLDRAAQLHFNAVLFQVRSVSDAMYVSSIEPWSEYLTGTQGRAPVPFYDPLAFAVAEAHRRGLALHAWFNPFRAGHPQSKSPAAPNHITRTLPALVRHYGDQTVLDPGEPATQARAVAVILDVVKRYDVDGVVIDDYFYPYPQKNAVGLPLDFPDEAAWKRYGAGGGLSRADWRRDNVNRFVFKLSQGIKAEKPWVQFGVSPFGIWRPKNPPSIAGMDAFDKIYADSRKWLAEGWVDYLAPQLYWATANPSLSFPVLFQWWRAQDIRNRHVWPALSDANVGTKFGADEIARQIQTIRGRKDPGAIHYHLRSVLDNPALAALVANQYAVPALIPNSPWLARTSPPPPSVTATVQGRTTQVRWLVANPRPAWWLLQYRSNGAWTSAVLPGGRGEATLDNVSPDAVALRAVDRLGTMSVPAIWTPRRYVGAEPGRGPRKP